MMTTDALAERQTDTARALQALRARLPELALQATQGDPAAAAELQATEDQIAALERAGSRLGLASGEAARLEAAAAAQAAAERTLALEAAHAAAAADRQAAYQQVVTACAALCQTAMHATERGDELDRLAGQLGRPPAAYETRLQVGEYLLSELARVLPGVVIPHPGTAGRPLVEPSTETEA